MRPVLLGLSLAVTATIGAWAQQPRTVAYFIMHNAERAQMERACSGGSTSRVIDAECINAHQAGYWILKAEAQQRVNRGRTDVGSIDSPAFFDANPIARSMVLRDCIHPSSAIRPDATECQAARISAGQ